MKKKKNFSCNKSLKKCNKNYQMMKMMRKIMFKNINTNNMQKIVN